ncbi:MAG: aspartate carbamoyltransferase catalytic subunit [Mariprofundaceae bacterium]|nr:aspartate carbamoyltransferase catalytic subunit [Mariprofundaceae bacterium]
MRHLLGIADLSSDDIMWLLQLGESMLDINRRSIKKAPTLRGKTIINLFFENSTRTRTSFEIAGKRLSADVINISASTSATKKGESLLDTGQTLAAMQPHLLVVRHGLAGSCAFLAEYLQNTAIINAGDGSHEHPTQILTDLLTIQQSLGSFEGKIMTLVGDIAHSRVARSHLLAAKIMGYHIRLVAPKTLLPLHVARYGCSVYHDFDAAIPGSDIIYMLRVQNERLTSACCFPSIREYHEAYGLHRARQRMAGDHCLIMHPGPMNRGVEISSDVADSLNSRVLHQVENGVSIRMALLTHLINANNPPMLAHNNEDEDDDED